jgi:outer membrane protein OmpA-like peptidoglycan-associated protein
MMKLSQSIAPALAAILVTACASHTTSAPDRAEQAEADKQHAQDDARQARIDAEKARLEAQDAARAQREADEKAQYAAQAAAQAERDAQVARTGVAEPQPLADGRAVVSYGAFGGPGVAFEVGSYDLSADERARLDDVAATLRAHPSRKVIIDGYSDETGTDSTDARISQRRADAVAHYLENRGVASDRIVTRVGRWDTTEVSNRRRHGHRRVEIVVQ